MRKYLLFFIVVIGLFGQGLDMIEQDVTVQRNDDIALGKESVRVVNEKRQQSYNSMQVVADVRERRIETLYKFIDSKAKRYDFAEDVVYIEDLEKLSGEFGFYLYMMAKGKEVTGDKSIFGVLYYDKNDIVELQEIHFCNTQRDWSLRIQGFGTDYKANEHKIKIKDVGSVHYELREFPVHRIQNGLRTLAYGEESNIDFIGKNAKGITVRRTKRLSAYDIDYIRGYLDVVDMVDIEKDNSKIM